MDLADRLQVFVATNDREAALRMFLPEAIGHSDEAIKQMPHGQLAVLAGQEHAAASEASELVVGELVRFLNS